MVAQKLTDGLDDERHSSVSSDEAFTEGDPEKELTEEDSPGEEAAGEEETAEEDGIEPVEGYDKSVLSLAEDIEKAEFSEEALAEIDKYLSCCLKSETGFLPETVCGRDDRVRITATNLIPWRWVCHLRIRTKDDKNFGCTGFLIGPHTVITAGHCVYHHSHGGWPKHIDVMPGRNASNLPYGSVRATSFRSVKGWVNNHNANYDYGAIILPTELGNRTGWFGFACYNSSTLLHMLVNNSGYPGDKPVGTQWFNANEISQVTSRKLHYYIDTMGGQSGSPVWCLKSGHRYVVGVHAYGGCPNSSTRIVEAVYDNFKKWKG